MNRQNYILVIDDEPHMRRVLEIMLRQAGHKVFSASDGLEALELMHANRIDLVITDMRMPRMDGIELLSRMRAEDNQTPVIVVTAHGSIESAVDAMRHGASDYILRPFDLETLELAISRVLKEAEVALQNDFLREELGRGWDAFVGGSESMQSVYNLIRQVGPTRTAVMIIGETGTGKELAARAIHNASTRRDKLFVPINCAAIPADILEAELFGYEKGAFTGAVKERIGKFELANAGTLFLDEITEMPMQLQAKLLRVLQENTLERLGSNRSVALDLRVIAATNRNPREAIAEGRLREDLFYRLNVFALELPPLRRRKGDIPALVAHFVEKHAPRRVKTAVLEAGAAGRLAAYDWPGNVRELENMVERALVLCQSGVLEAAHFPLDVAVAKPAPAEKPDVEVGPMTPVVEALEARMIELALAQTEGSKPRAAALLDISERSLWYKIKKYWPKDSA